MTTSDQNSLDHHLAGVPFLASEDAVTMDEVFRGTEEEIECKFAAALTMHCKVSDILFVAHEKRWIQDGKGLMASKSVSVVFIDLNIPLTPYKNSAIDAGIKMRPTKEELSSMSPEFDHRWRTFFANAPDKPVILAIPFAGCACI
jgi:alcohol oxidase